MCLLTIKHNVSMRSEMYEELRAERQDRAMARIAWMLGTLFVVGVLVCWYFGIPLDDAVLYR